jgi:thiol-disulfide isomerase/thioredoxin
MTRGLLILAFPFIFGISNSLNAGTNETSLLAIQFYADWCKFCKKLKPSFDELKSSYTDRVEFIILDYTDKETLEITEDIIEERDLKQVVENYAGTGFIVLVEQKTDGSKTVRGVLNKKLDLDEMKEIVESHL